jgi:hypothetical protein
MKLPVYESELFAEASELANLKSSLSDGMTVFTARNFARPAGQFSAEVAPLPDQLVEAAEYTRAFLSWQYDRAKKPDKPRWDNPDVVQDCYLYIVRHIWLRKLENPNGIEHPGARMIAVLMAVQKEIRTRVHEGINHAAKHNKDVAALGSDIRDEIDSTVRALLDESAKQLATQVKTDLKVLGELMQRNLLEDHTDGDK